MQVGLKVSPSTLISPSLISPESKSLSTTQILGPTKSTFTIFFLAAKSLASCGTPLFLPNPFQNCNPNYFSSTPQSSQVAHMNSKPWSSSVNVPFEVVLTSV